MFSVAKPIDKTCSLPVGIYIDENGRVCVTNTECAQFILDFAAVFDGNKMELLRNYLKNIMNIIYQKSHA